MKLFPTKPAGNINISVRALKAGPVGAVGITNNVAAATISFL
jgi:hypothetical protein